LVTVSRTAPVAALVTVIVAPGSTAPARSTTRPLMVAVACANNGLLARAHNATARPAFLSMARASSTSSIGQATSTSVPAVVERADYRGLQHRVEANSSRGIEIVKLRREAPPRVGKS
jgi:hypothetical protein